MDIADQPNLTNKQLYMKDYYNKNKNKMLKQSYERLKYRRLLSARDVIVEKLNNSEYKRLPFSKIEKYNIIMSDDGKYL